MIHKNDLRIGNMVKVTKNDGYNKIGQTIKVDNIDYSGINSWKDMGASGCNSFDGIEGVPLTEEWLINFGFQFGDMGVKMYTIKTEIGHFFIDENFQPFLISGSIKKIKFVHELQNLYHSLFGSELVLKPIVPEAKGSFLLPVHTAC